MSSAGKVVEGGSTISQQLVRNLYTGREQTFDRKIKEACLAIKLSDKWSKDEDPRRPTSTPSTTATTPTASRRPRRPTSPSDARNLNLAQAALIAGLPQAPSIYDPLHNPKAALDRVAPRC